MVTIHTAFGAVLVLGALDGQTLTRDSGTNSLLVASMEYGFHTDGQKTTSKGDSEDTRGATPFFVVNVKPSMQNGP